MGTDNSDMVAYLQMIQSSIERMSSTSAIFKGFCATIVTGIAAVSFTEINRGIMLLAFSPVICFLILDIYYLQLERRFRMLYDDVRLGNHQVDYDLVPPKIKRSEEKTNATIISCILSPSIYLFYGPLIFIVAIIIIMKFMEVI